MDLELTDFGHPESELVEPRLVNPGLPRASAFPESRTLVSFSEAPVEGGEQLGSVVLLAR